MPRLIDWGVRFELIREAVVRVAARDGGLGVTYASIAAELHVSGSTLRRTVDSTDALPYLGVAWIARLRQYARFNHAKSIEVGSVAHVIKVIRRELPIDADEVDRERAWAALTAIGASEDCAKVRDEHHVFLDWLLAAAVARLLPDGQRTEFEVLRLRALMDGLIAAVCRESITVEQMLAVFDRHISDLLEQTASPLSPDGA
jgi:AcrR family transcriptional regulator